ncbi:MAG: hypothetical protein QOE16_49, partial [Microbacteriaceae bacterium]|nr:hypothetical protein [Microbacteriaceae bacterium]
MGFANTVKDLGFRAMSRAHKALLIVSGGLIGWSLGSLPVVELHTIGRSSGT